MIIINITPEEVLEAKELTNILDANKRYNKFECSTNYIGALGELVFHKYLSENMIPHTWVSFNREGKGFDEPDFIVGNCTIDLKTTYSDKMWFQQPKHDIYIYAQITSDNQFLLLSGFITRGGLGRAVRDKVAEIVIRDGRVDYTITSNNMLSMELLAPLCLDVTQVYNQLEGGNHE